MPNFHYNVAAQIRKAAGGQQAPLDVDAITAALADITAAVNIISEMIQGDTNDGAASDLQSVADQATGLDTAVKALRQIAQPRRTFKYRR